MFRTRQRLVAGLILLICTSTANESIMGQTTIGAQPDVGTTNEESSSQLYSSQAVSIIVSNDTGQYSVQQRSEIWAELASASVYLHRTEDVHRYTDEVLKENSKPSDALRIARKVDAFESIGKASLQVDGTASSLRALFGRMFSNEEQNAGYSATILKRIQLSIDLLQAAAGTEDGVLSSLPLQNQVDLLCYASDFTQRLGSPVKSEQLWRLAKARNEELLSEVRREQRLKDTEGIWHYNAYSVVLILHCHSAESEPLLQDMLDSLEKYELADDGRIANVASVLAKYRASKGDWDGANQALQTVSPFSSRWAWDEARLSYCQYLSTTNDIRSADRIAQEIEDPIVKIRGYCSLAAAFSVRSKRLEREDCLRELSESIANEQLRPIRADTVKPFQEDLRCFSSLVFAGELARLGDPAKAKNSLSDTLGEYLRMKRSNSILPIARNLLNDAVIEAIRQICSNSAGEEHSSGTAVWLASVPLEFRAFGYSRLAYCAAFHGIPSPRTDGPRSR